VADGSAQQTRWSPDGNLLPYLSKRDGFVCLWAQRLEPATKRPAGSAFAVYHSHSIRRSLGGVLEGSAGPEVVRGKIVIALKELTGNVWMAELPQGK